MSDPTKAAVALSGAHSIGNIRSTMPHDAANGAGFGGFGPVCIGGPGPMTAQPNLFNNHYYNEAGHPSNPPYHSKTCRSIMATLNISAIDPLNSIVMDLLGLRQLGGWPPRIL